jgi:hypothetical protein
MELGSPGIATPTFENATGSGRSGWKTLSYADLARAQHLGIQLQEKFAGINTDKADITAFRNLRGKLIYYHGLADQLIVPQGTNEYFTRVRQKLGGDPAKKDFYRYFQIPGMGQAPSTGSRASVRPQIRRCHPRHCSMTHW